MPTSDNRCLFPVGKRAIFLLSALFLLIFLPILPVMAPSRSLAEAEGKFNLPANEQIEADQSALIEGNSFLEVSPHSLPEKEHVVLETILMTITAYSSSVWETDDTPFLTAAGTETRDGVVASNLLPFGAKIRIPKYFGDKVFTVEDRMAQRVGDFNLDVWFPSAWQARQFGVKHTYIETVQ